MGISWGGAVAQQFAFQHLARTGKAIFAATAPGGFVNQSGQVNISGPGARIWGGDVLNHASGVFKVTGTTVTYTGTFTNDAAYISDPAHNNFQTLIVGTTGYLQGGLGDVFSIAGDLLNHSLRNTDWSTGSATLAFTGAGAHEFDFAGLDLGANMAGRADNFAFGDLQIADGAILNVMDGNTGNASTAFYTGLFDIAGHDLGELQNIFSAYNIYYDASMAGNAYLNDQTYALNGGGHLIAYGNPPPPSDMPEPGTIGMVLVGLLGIGWSRLRQSARLTGSGIV